MYFANTSSRILHNPVCHHVKRIGSNNLIGFERIEDAQKEGYRQCICCDPMVRQIQAYEEEMVKYCQIKGISYQINNGELCINTPFSEWKVYIGNNGKYDLYHRNTRGKTNEFHLQRKGMKSPMTILRYVDGHDSYRIAHPLPKKHKSKSVNASGLGKRYNKMVRRAEKDNKMDEVKRVLVLIDSLAMA